MVKHILLLGRKGIVVSDAESQLDDPDIAIQTGTSIEDVKVYFSQAEAESYNIDHVFMGAGIDLDKRLDIVKEIFNRSSVTTVHLKDATSGPKGFLPFVKTALQGLKNYDAAAF